MRGAAAPRPRRRLVLVAAAPAPAPAWPQSVNNSFPPGHYAAVAASSIKWIYGAVGAVAVVDPARVLAAAYAPVAANWALPLTRALGSNLVMVAGCIGALQLFTQAGLAASPPAEALTLGLLAAAAFRVLHLAMHKPLFNPTFWAADLGLALVAALFFAWRTAAAASAKAAAPGPTAGMSPLLPGKTALATAYGLLAILFAVGGVVLTGAPPTFGDAVLAAPLGAAGAAMRVAFGSGLLFPGAFAAWALKDGADAGTLAWPPLRALNWALLVASLNRVVVAVTAFQGGVFVAGAPWPVMVALHASAAAVALAGLAAGRK
jgi:hypothetical protein